jgi:spermidine synthase
MQQRLTQIMRLLARKLFSAEIPLVDKQIARSSPDQASGTHNWFEIPGKLISVKGRIRVLEPSGANLSELIDSFRHQRYSKPYVIDDGTTRHLYFDMRFLQSAMSTQHPHKLLLAYTCHMMAFLLFQPDPAHIVIVGLGGGSLTRACYRQLPRARITTIEIDEHVIALGELFEVPRSDARMRLLHADAIEYFAASGELADVVMVDACNKDGIAAAFREAGFYQNLRNRLTANGIAVINLIGLEDRAYEVRRIIYAAFEQRCLHIEIAAGNHLLFGIKNPDFNPDWASIKRCAKELQKQTGLEFTAFAKLLEHSFKRGLVE